MPEKTSQVSSDLLVSLARDAINSYVSEGRIINPDPNQSELSSLAACFVSIHLRSTGDLRGCMGTIMPMQENLGSEIVYNAISAATQDPRFRAVREEELSDLNINVDVLSDPEPARIKDLDPRIFGVIVTQNHKRGLLLPDLEGVDSVQDQIDIACSKAGIDPSSTYTIERFEVVRHL